MAKYKFVKKDATKTPTGKVFKIVRKSNQRKTRGSKYV